MTDFTDNLAKLKTTPATELPGKAARWLAKQLRRTPARSGDRLRSSYRPAPGPAALACHFAPGDPALLHPDVPTVRELSRLFLEHRFDLLGSGWVRVEHGMQCRGLEGRRYRMGSQVRADRSGGWLAGRINRANLGESRRIWSLVDEGYLPLDWQLDFKSGYRWREGCWYLDIRYGGMPGADVKVPWELARMQHLPQLAFAYALARRGTPGFLPPERYLREFRNQVLDFIACNPPRFGVNWSCTMEVGIRLANWLVSLDLFRAFGASFDPEFEAVLAHSTYQHGRHCLENLEFLPDLRTNHYLSDIAGLLFAAAYLPASAETDGWLRFAVRELVGEMEQEFHPDGSNFEASTSYHRLSTEIMLYASLLCLLLPRERCGEGAGGPLPPRFWERLERACEFSHHLTKPDGTVPQFGDNDNGRFLKLAPVVRFLTLEQARERYRNLAGGAEGGAGESYPDEEVLDHRHLGSLASVLFERPELAGGGNGLEAELAAALLGGRCPGSCHATGKTPAPQGARPAGELYSYPGIGIHLYRSARLYLAIRCGSVGQNGYGGHAHNDQLSFELCLDGQPLVVDAGSYIYTAHPELRNRYRATGAHNTVQCGAAEQCHWPAGPGGLFRLSAPARAVCREWQATDLGARFSGELAAQDYLHRREISVAEPKRSLRIVDRLGPAALALQPRRFLLHSTLKPELSGDTLRLGAALIRARGAHWEAAEFRLSTKYGSQVAGYALSAHFAGEIIEVEVHYD